MIKYSRNINVKSFLNAMWISADKSVFVFSTSNDFTINPSKGDKKFRHSWKPASCVLWLWWLFSPQYDDDQNRYVITVYCIVTLVWWLMSYILQTCLDMHCARHADLFAQKNTSTLGPTCYRDMILHSACSQMPCFVGHILHLQKTWILCTTVGNPDHKLFVFLGIGKNLHAISSELALYRNKINILSSNQFMTLQYFMPRPDVERARLLLWLLLPSGI